MSSLCENTDSEKSIIEELIPKKVRFRVDDVDTNNNMLIDSSPEKSISWRDMLVGQSSKDTLIDLEGKDDLDILDGDIQKTFVDGVPSISFSDRIHKILIQDTKRHKGKEIMHGNSMEKISAIPNNDRIVGERNSNNKSILKEVGLMGNCGPIFKGNSRILSEPSKPNTSRKEKFHNLKKSDSSLGIGIIPAGQARGVLERSDPDLVAHYPSVAAGKGSQTFTTDELQTVPGDDIGLGFEGEGSKNQPDLEESRRTVVSLDVGNLDSGRHSAVVFHENTQAKEMNNAHPSLVLPGGSVQRTPLKESMEVLTESISTFAKCNIEVDSSFKIGGQKEGVNVPGQIWDSLDLLSLGKEAVLLTDCSSFQGRPFRFLTGWTKHSDFSNLVRERWNFADIINRIISILPPHPDSGSDRIIWTKSASGVFSVKSAYWHLKENSWNSQEDYWKIVWKYPGPQRVRVFLWFAFKQKLLTNSERARRGFSHCSSCSICGHEFEDLVHVLRDCPPAKEVWRLVIPNQLKQRFFSVSFQDWLILNLCFHERLQDYGLVWSCLFGLVAWRIWKNRNLFIFQHISWTASEVVFLSTDGAVARDSGYAATGGVARDRDGNWIVGFNRFLGVCSPFEVEVWAILDGILILLNKGYKQIIIMTDNLEVEQILNDMDLEDSGITVLRRTLRILHSEGEWRIKHIPRNQNLVADRLAKLSLSWKSSLQVIDEAPRDILDLLQEDKINGCFM
ncbi:hypothetical protein Gotur_003309 [Gossypium turneri]